MNRLVTIMKNNGRDTLVPMPSMSAASYDATARRAVETLRSPWTAADAAELTRLANRQTSLREAIESMIGRDCTNEEWERISGRS